jgi:hypothetical protein
VVLPASGWDIIAKVLRLEISFLISAIIYSFVLLTTIVYYHKYANFARIKIFIPPGGLYEKFRSAIIVEKHKMEQK